MKRDAQYHHVPVLLNEVMELLSVKSGDTVVDATLGGGGYSHALLQAVGKDGWVLSIDLDDAALEHYRLLLASSSLKERALLAHGNFRDIDKIVGRYEIGVIRGIVADIGLSSYQLDQSGRGISFQNEEALDMRFDQKSDGPNAQFILHHSSQDELADLFRRYGEDKHSGRIARVIVQRRETDPVRTTKDLFMCIEQALPKPERHRAADSARRIFQALRIAVNHELENLEIFLPRAFEILAPGGRLAVVTFHSLEDRIVKHYFQQLATGCVCPPDFPQCVCGKLPLGDLITKKPVVASSEELERNSRSQSAKLRVIEKRTSVSF